MDAGTKRPISRWEAIGFVGELFAVVAIPSTLLALAGRWLDNRYGLTPWASLAGLFLALGVAALFVFRRGKRMAARISGSGTKPASLKEKEPPSSRS